MKTASRILGILSICLLTALPVCGQEIYEFEIVQFDTMNGYPGYYQIMTVNDSIHETDFFFEEGEYLRWYACKMSWQTAFWLMPDSTYIIKTDSLEIGDTWNSWGGEPATASVIDTATITVPAGTFFTYMIVSTNSTNDTMFTGWWSYNIGRIKSIHWSSGVQVLTDYLITGGNGYWPLAVGNWWRIEPPQIKVERRPVALSPESCGYIYSYPNPFNSRAVIEFMVDSPGQVDMVIFDALGREVIRLLDEYHTPGLYSIVWNGMDDHGIYVPSGCYFCRLRQGWTIVQNRMLLVK